MQENEFETRVQQQMEEFRVRPSEAVWEKVDEELRKKKKRRVVFYLFLLAGLGLFGYSGYFLFNNSKPNLVQQNAVPPDNDLSIKGNGKVPGIEKSVDNAQRSKKENQLFFKEKSSSTKIGDSVLNDKKAGREQNIVVKRPVRSSIKETAVRPLPGETINKDNALVNNNLEQTSVKPSRQKEEAETPVISKADITQPVVVEKSLEEDNQLPVPEKTIQTKKDSITGEIAANNEEIPVTAKKMKKASKINWGIDLSVGISSNRENIFSFYDGQKSNAADIYAPPTTGGNPNIVYSPSSIRSGLAFRSGLVAELKVSKKSSISSGLRYAYFSNRIQVGAYKDTSVVLNNAFSQADRINAVYSGVHQKEYTNHFHFIQWPVQYQLQLNKGIKLPILWSIGASAGYLFATNGLVYDTAAGGIYYRNNDAFNKIHFSLNTGFSFRFGGQKKMQWSLGPELSLGMSKLMKDDFTKKQYLLYGGMTGRIIFTKKK